jgi:hypothetical protein
MKAIRFFLQLKNQPITYFSNKAEISMKLPAASGGVSCEILRSRYPPSPGLRRVLLAFIPAANYGVFGE